MDELHRDVAAALSTVQPRWGGLQTDRALVGFHRRLRRSLALKCAGSVLVIAACAWAAWPYVAIRTTAATIFHTQRGVLPVGSQIPFVDGSTVTALEPNTEVSLLENRPDRIVAELHRGRASFVLSPNPDRVFRVEAGPTTVEARAATFTLERRDPLLGVTVGDGRVRVDWLRGSRELDGDGDGWFPPPSSEGDH